MSTQVLVRTIGGTDDFHSLGAEATSCSIIVMDGDWISGDPTPDERSTVDRPTPDQCEIERPVITQIVDEQLSTFHRIRPEVLVVTGADRSAGRATSMVRGRRPYRIQFLTASDDNYCSALIEGVESASNEFIVIPRHGDDPLVGLSAVLGHMWLEGADMALLPDMSSPRPTVSSGDDPIASLPGLLGLEQCCRTSMTIVMRRWFAKWIFNEVDQLPDPVDELADRIRLLGSTILLMEWNTAECQSA